MKRVITYGTFDLLHYGHINLLRRAKAYGDYLIVALSTDEFNWNEKHKNAISLMKKEIPAGSHPLRRSGNSGGELGAEGK